jgi:hypothetical protein
MLEKEKRIANKLKRELERNSSRSNDIAAPVSVPKENFMNFIVQIDSKLRQKDQARFLSSITIKERSYRVLDLPQRSNSSANGYVTIQVMNSDFTPSQYESFKIDINLEDEDIVHL